MVRCDSAEPSGSVDWLDGWGSPIDPCAFADTLVKPGVGSSGADCGKPPRDRQSRKYAKLIEGRSIRPSPSRHRPTGRGIRWPPACHRAALGGPRHRQGANSPGGSETMLPPKVFSRSDRRATPSRPNRARIRAQVVVALPRSCPGHVPSSKSTKGAEAGRQACEGPVAGPLPMSPCGASLTSVA